MIQIKHCLFWGLLINTALPCSLSAKDSVVVVIYVKGVEKLKWNR